MSDRDCENCARCGRDGCKSWDCDFVPRKEAIEAWKEMQNLERYLKLQGIIPEWVNKEENDGRKETEHV